MFIVWSYVPNAKSNNSWTQRLIFAKHLKNIYLYSNFSSYTLYIWPFKIIRTERFESFNYDFEINMEEFQ